jgi:hypothetical protein
MNLHEGTERTENEWIEQIDGISVSSVHSCKIHCSFKINDNAFRHPSNPKGIAAQSPGVARSGAALGKMPHKKKSCRTQRV